MYVGEDKSFIKNKELGMAAARQMRDDAWLAATSRFEKAPAGYITISIHKAQGLMTSEMLNGPSPADDAATDDHGRKQQKAIRLPDPYVVLEFEQLDPVDGSPRTETWTCVTKPKSCSPVWDDGEATFKIAVWDLSEPRLYLHVYDDSSHLPGSDAFVGEAVFDKDKILGLMATAGTKQNDRLALERCSQTSKVGGERFARECYGGTLSVSACYDFPMLALGVIKVTAVGARDLLAADHTVGTDASEDTSDPFATITVVQQRDGKEITQKYQTKKVDHSLNPEWGESFYFDIWSKDAVLYCDVYDADYASDDYLGQGKLALRGNYTSFLQVRAYLGLFVLTDACGCRLLPGRDGGWPSLRRAEAYALHA